MLSPNSLGHRQPPDNSVPERKGVGAHYSTTAFRQPSRSACAQYPSIPEGGQRRSCTVGSGT